MILKIYDSCILIRILEEITCKEIFERWNSNPRYQQWITAEVNGEIGRNARKELNDLISRNIINIFDPIPRMELIKIKNLNPQLSFADCSLFYYSRRYSNSICLSDDNPLRTLFKKQNLRFHGTIGIYLKLKADHLFPLNELENKFEKLKKNARVFPSSLKIQ